MQFQVTILGCGAATPTSRHKPTAQVVNVHDKYFLIDCGEGTQMQLRKFKVKMQRIQAIFISHLHGDHFFGLVGIGIASLIPFLLYAFYVIPILKKKYDFSIRKDTLKILLMCLLFGISSSAITFTIDYPLAYYPLGLILIFSLAYSYRELNKRVAINSYWRKFIYKFKRNG
jgi:hypothetical protein